jgi:hypothetical protein
MAEASRAEQTDPRVLDAWCEWLNALATDSKAALAAAMAYRELNTAGRDRWLSALEQDTAGLSVPKIAVYMPLLFVEHDPERLDRIARSMDWSEDPRSNRRAMALKGMGKNGLCVGAIVRPLYLNFSEVLVCGYDPSRGFEWVRHDPIMNVTEAPMPGVLLEGVKLERTPLKSLIDELAHSVLAHQRQGRSLPEALRVFADLFGVGNDGLTMPSSP